MALAVWRNLLGVGYIYSCQIRTQSTRMGQPGALPSMTSIVSLSSIEKMPAWLPLFPPLVSASGLGTPSGS